jgi:hypothetical protein
MRTDLTILSGTGCGHGTCMAREAQSNETADTMHAVVPVKHISETPDTVSLLRIGRLAAKYLRNFDQTEARRVLSWR